MYFQTLKKSILVLFMFLSLIGHSQVKSISGKVVDELGMPIPGTSVFIKGTNLGTTTDLNGLFDLVATVNSNDILVLSYVGMVTEEIVIGSQTNINVTLKEDIDALKEVVVVGYGTQKKGDITGSVSTIDSDQFKSRSVGQIGNLIQGQATGVQVLNSSGKPSQGLNLRIRGTSSISSGSEPLYVVDGVPTTDTRSVNPSDIESITVLKDASSAAIYGAQGANGVVLITTKKGTTSKPIFSFDTYTGVSQAWKTLKVLNAEQYRDLMTELGYNTNWNQFTNNTDWQQEIFQNGFSQSYQFSVSGRNDTGTNYYFSGGYLGQKGAVRSAEVNRFNLKVNLDQKINDYIKIGTRIAYTQYDDVDINENNNVNVGGVLLGALTTPSVIGVFNPNGSFTSNPFQNWENPLASTDGLDRKFKSNRILANVYLEAKILQKFTYKSSFGIDNGKGVFNSFLDPFRTGFGNAIGGQSIRTSNDNFFYILDNTIAFKNKIQKHTFDALIGSVLQKNTFENSAIEVRNFGSAAISTPNGGSEIITATASQAEKTNVSFISRLNYDYDDKYLLTVNFRADASSVFGPNNRWGYFPSFSAGWKVSNEQFLKESSVIHDLKLRAGWGVVGNDQIANYAFFGRIGSGANYPIAGAVQPGTFPSTLENLSLKWEETTQTNIGFDFATWGGRIKLTADAYVKNTKDLLYNAPLPTSSGFDRALQNIGEVQNRGFELGVTSVNLDKILNWTSTFNISFNENEVISLIGEQVLSGGISGRGEAVILKEGLPLGSLYGYVFGGVDPTTGNAFYIDRNGVSTFNPSEEDRVVIGDANPDFIYSLNNTFSYKGISLNIFFEGSYGNDLLNATRIETEGMIDPKNQSIAVLNRWRQPGDVTNIPRASFGNTDNSRISTRFIEDASYLRLKALTLGYDCNETLTKKLKLSSLKFYITGENLLTFTNYTGFDPEVNAFGGANVERGIDFGSYPQSRTFILGMNVSF
jgi:TonB-linked SusC/RagA family outer membrane protein